ncbi:MAG: hypothetical protein GX590_12460, partial [Lentisphaerae bacterium]|nr:hypothetical protein [Lentisphaerota bacterium]
AVADARSIEVEVPPGSRYLRFACWGRGEAMAWTQPFFVDEANGAAHAATHLRNWQASSLLENDSLDAASPAEAAKLPFESVPASAKLPGFTDLRGSIQGGNGVVYAQTSMTGARAGRGMLSLGYDGPIRIWLNGQEVFHGPGSNPARADQLRLYVDLQEGANSLLIAFHSNRAKAWGFWCRAEQDGHPLQ